MNNFPDGSKLTHLSLGATQVGDVGLARIKDCNNLKGLCLAETKVSDEGLKHLHGLKMLGEVNLKKTNVSADGARKLAAKVPSCKVVTDHGDFGPAMGSSAAFEALRRDQIPLD